MNVVSLYDESGNMLRPWAEAGCDVYCIDILNNNKCEQVGLGRIYYIKADMSDKKTHLNVLQLKPKFVAGFPPCTDLAVSGSKHFEAKSEENPYFQEEALELVLYVERLGKFCECPWFFENPVSVISTLFRKPDYIFNPYEFGGYLPTDDIHPRWPEFIPPRDAYTKRTCLWAGGGFVMPGRKAVPAMDEFPGWRRLGGKSAKTKQIRSETPRGFARAVFEANFKGC